MYFNNHIKIVLYVYDFILGGDYLSKKSKRILNLALLVVWLIVIFMYSSQPGEESSEKSQLVIDIFSYIGIDLNSTLGSMTSFVVRKSAHMTEYFILCFLTYRVLRGYSLKNAQWYGVIFSFLYASTDEFHQTFIPGRTGCFQDVLIDTTGALIFALFITLVIRVRYNKSKTVKGKL